MYGQLIYWLLLLELLSFAAFPLVYRAFSRLPDRGYALSKPAGLLLVSVAAWFIGFSHVIPNSRWSVMLALLVVGGTSWLAMRGRGSELTRYLRASTRTVVATEAVFIGVFLIFAMLRAASPDITHTEQPMDFMFLNAVVTSPSFPPQDPWLAGEAVSYYYFGYLMVGTLTLLSGLATAVAYNLGLASVAALAAVASFGVVLNLVRASGASRRGAIVAGLSAVFLLLFASNLEGTLELARSSAAGTAAFWGSVGIDGLTPLAAPSASWDPEGAWWWWRASRVIPGTINEFPMFSLLLGDLHPHVMSMPFVLLMVGVAIQLYLTPRLVGTVALPQVRLLAAPAAFAVALVGAALVFINWPAEMPDWAQTWFAISGLVALPVLGLLTLIATAAGIAWWARDALRSLGWPLVLLTVLSLGALGATNLWDLPLGLALMGGAVLLNAARHARNVEQRLGRALVIGWLIAALAILLFIPFYLTFETTGSGVLALRGLVTRPVHLFLVWGVLGALALSLLATLVPRALPVGGNRVVRFGVALYIALAPLMIWFHAGARLFTVTIFVMVVVAVVFALRRAGYRLLAADEVNFAGTGTGMTAILVGIVAIGGLVWDGALNGERIDGATSAAWGRLLIVVPMALLVALAIYAAWSLAHQDSQRAAPRWSGMVPALGLMVVAGALIMGAELFYVVDFFGGSLRRMNTVFKFYYQAWLLLSIVGGVALWYVTTRWDRRVLGGRVGIVAWCGLLALTFGALAYYPAAGFNARTEGGGSLTLDGQRHVAERAPAEAAAILWVRDELPRDAVVVEAAEVPCGDASGGCSDWTDVGRIAGSTGRPTIVGWEQHEIQWRSSSGAVSGRRADVRLIYETLDLATAAALLEGYGADYIVIGPRERWAYGDAGLAKFAQLGTPVYPENGVGEFVVYQLLLDARRS